MGFITQLINRASYPALIEKYQRIADENSLDNQINRDNLSATLQRYRDNVTAKTPPQPRYSYIVWENRSTEFGSSATGDLGRTVSGGNKLVFHVAKEINHDFLARTTQYPVESGSDITDHVVIENSRFSVSALFSNASSNLIDAAGVVGAQKDQDECLRLLRSLQTEKTVVSLSSTTDFYENLIITRIGIPTSAANGTGYNIDIEFEEIRKVGLLVVKNVQKAKGQAVDKVCAPKVDEGTKVASDKPVDPNGSLFYTESLKQFIDDTWTEKFGYGAGGG